MKRLLILIFITLFFGSLQAKTYERCFEKAAAKHNISIHWLYAVAFTESSFKANSRNKNRNGSKDYGFMQINSLWRTAAKKMGYDWHQVKNNPCTNIMFGTHILKKNFKRTKSMQKAIGAYNAGFSNTPKARKLRNRYFRKVSRNRYVAKRYLKRLKIKAT